MFPDTLITSAHTLYTHTHTHTHTHKYTHTSSQSTCALSHRRIHSLPRGGNTSTAPVTLADVHGVTAAARPWTHTAGRAVRSAVTHPEWSCHTDSALTEMCSTEHKTCFLQVWLTGLNLVQWITIQQKAVYDCILNGDFWPGGRELQLKVHIQMRRMTTAAAVWRPSVNVCKRFVFCRSVNHHRANCFT